MKKFAWILIAISLMIVSIIGNAQASLITTGSALDATLLYYEPIPAQPGDEVEVWIQISNDGGSPSKSGTITLIESGPFKLVEDKDFKFPPIPGQENFLLKTKIRITKDANEGENSFKIKVQETGSSDWIERDMSLTIQGKSGALSIVEAKTIPEIIKPGESGILDVKVKNVGDTKLRNVDVALDLTDISLAPTSSSNSKTINSLLGGQEYDFKFEVTAFPDAEVQANQLPITLSYEDEQGNEEVQTETIGFIIGTEPELLVYFEKIGLTQENKQGDIIIKFVNKGLSEIKLLEMRLDETKDFELLSESNIIYVGNIDEDDYESAEISIKTSENAIEVPLTVKYRDALNKEYEDDIVLPLELKSSNGDGKKNYAWTIIIILVIVIGVWWYFKKNKKRRK